MKRCVLEQRLAGFNLVGTLHDPRGDGGSLDYECFRGEVGLLCLNFGQQPRSWRGDLGAFLCDAVARSRIPAVRFDMPGLGDADGTVPDYLEEFLIELQYGKHVPCAAQLIDACMERFGFRSMFISGFCGGAITAVLAARARPRAISGIVVFEPEFVFTPHPETGREGPLPEHSQERSVIEGIEESLLRARQMDSWTRLAQGRVDLGYYRRLVSDALRSQVMRWRRGRALPADAIRDVVFGWEALARAGLPFLVYSVDAPHRNIFYAAYDEYTGRGSRPNVTWIALQNTNHALVIGGAKDRIAESMPVWLRSVIAQGQCDPRGTESGR